jgi:hypothetical protein
MSKLEKLYEVDYANRGRTYYTSITGSCPGVTRWDKFCTFTIDVGDASRAAIGQPGWNFSGINRGRFQLARGSSLLGGDEIWGVGE